MYLDILFLLYSFSTIITIIAHIILKCKYNNHFFDQFIYLGDNNILKYILTHVIMYFVAGMIFGHNKFLLTLIKTVVVEISIVAVENCSIYKINNLKSAFFSIIIGLCSFYTGGIFNKLLWQNK